MIQRSQYNNIIEVTLPVALAKFQVSCLMSIMSYTEEQKAYILRKMRVRMSTLDINKDGHISYEDYELMGKKLAEHCQMTGEQAEATKKEFTTFAEMLSMKPGEQISVEEAAKKVSEIILASAPKQNKALFDKSHNMLFDAIDTNKNGKISVKELKEYFKITVPGVSEAEVTHSFNTIDTNKNGVISQEEFMAAAEDFFRGVEETELSKVFLGRLVD